MNNITFVDLTSNHKVNGIKVPNDEELINICHEPQLLVHEQLEKSKNEYDKLKNEYDNLNKKYKEANELIEELYYQKDKYEELHKQTIDELNLKIEEHKTKINNLISLIKSYSNVL